MLGVWGLGFCSVLSGWLGNARPLLGHPERASPREGWEGRVLSPAALPPEKALPRPSPANREA